MTIEAMKQALAVLEEIADEVFSPYDNKLGDAILALRVAIEQAEKSEPVGWVECDGVVVWYNRDAAIGRDLYTTPRQWQGLTDEEVSEILDREIGFNSCFGPETNFARAIEAKLKEKNG